MIILEIVKAILHYALGLRLPLRLPKRKKNPTDSRFYPIHRPYNTMRLITGTANAIERELNVSRISYITLAFARVMLVFSSRFAPFGQVLLMLGRVLLILGRVLLALGEINDILRTCTKGLFAGKSVSDFFFMF